MGLASEVFTSEEVVALALAADDMAMEHFLVTCPVLLQKRQRHCVNDLTCCHKGRTEVNQYVIFSYAM